MSKLLAFALALLLPAVSFAAPPLLKKGGGDGALRTARITFTTGDSGQSADIPNVCSNWRISYISGTGGVADVYALQSPGQAVASGTLLSSFSITSANVTTVSTSWPYLAVNVNTAPSGNTTATVFMYCVWEGAGPSLDRSEHWMAEVDQALVITNLCLQTSKMVAVFNTNNTNAAVIPMACAALNGLDHSSSNWPPGRNVKVRQMSCFMQYSGATNNETITFRGRWRNMAAPATQAFAGSNTVTLTVGATGFWETTDLNDTCPYSSTGCGIMVRISAETVTTGSFSVSCTPIFEVS